MCHNSRLLSRSLCSARQLVHRAVFTDQANTDPPPGSRLLRFTWPIILDMVLIPKELISGKNHKFWVYNFTVSHFFFIYNNDPGCNTWSSYLSHYKFQTSSTICCAAGSPTDGCASKFFKGRLTAHIKDSYNPYRLHSSFFMKWAVAVWSEHFPTKDWPLCGLFMNIMATWLILFQIWADNFLKMVAMRYRVSQTDSPNLCQAPRQLSMSRGIWWH